MNAQSATVVPMAHRKRQFVNLLDDLDNAKATKKARGEDVSRVYEDFAGEGYSKKVVKLIEAVREMEPEEMQVFDQAYQEARSHIGFPLQLDMFRENTA